MRCYPESPEVVRMENERRVTEEILEKKQRGEKLTEREARMLAYSPYGTAARSSFNPISVRTETDQKD